MAQPAVTVEGLDELRRVLRKVGEKDLVDQLKITNKAAAQLVVDAALPGVPVRSGRLRASVRALGSQRSGQAIAGKASAPYASAIHWGRKRGNVGSPPGNRSGRNPIAAQPFLRDAAQRSEERVRAQYAADIDRVLEAIRSVTG